MVWNLLAAGLSGTRRSIPSALASGMEDRPTVRRLSWGCGPKPAPGGLDADRIDAPGVDLRGDIRDGLAIPDEHVDYVASVHALQDLAYVEVLPALRELARVLRPGGVLRLVLRDLERAMRAYRDNDTGYFYIPDEDARSIGGKLVTQVVWYGSVRTPFTFDFAVEMLERAGFRDVVRCAFGETRSSCRDIATLDNRPRESLCVEAVRP